MLIGVDHGNKLIKTPGYHFISGLKEHTSRPLGNHVLKYNGKYYTLTSERVPFQWDKTTNDMFYILTLFAIANKIDRQGVYDPNVALDIQLSVGLPPAHYSALYERFELYFRRMGGIDTGSEPDLIEFEMDGNPYFIYMEDVQAFPQAYAAAVTDLRRIKELKRVLMIDIGGMTTDYMLIRDGQPDLSLCDSLELGVISLCNAVKSEVRGACGYLLEDEHIDAMLRGDNVFHDSNLMKLAVNIAQAFVENLLGQLRERQVDLRTTTAIFVGGGSSLLQKYIEPSESIGQFSIVDDIYANARGYEILYRRNGL